VGMIPFIASLVWMKGTVRRVVVAASIMPVLRLHIAPASGVSREPSRQTANRRALKVMAHWRCQISMA
jgi:hypothetical protein